MTASIDIGVVERSYSNTRGPVPGSARGRGPIIGVAGPRLEGDPLSPPAFVRRAGGSRISGILLPMNHLPSLPSSSSINLRRLLALRYIALAGQALAVWVAVVNLHMALPQRPLVWTIAGMAALNFLPGLPLRRRGA